MRSIRVFLVGATLAMLVLVVFVSAVQGYRAGMAETERVFDSQLQEQAHLAASVDASRFPVLVNATSTAFQRWLLVPGQPPQLLAHTQNAPDTVLGTFEPGFGYANFGGNRWRTYVHPVATGDVVVAAARMDIRYRLADDVVVETIMPIALWLPLSALLIWFITRRGLRPLGLLATQLHDKQSHDLSLVELAECPQELQPVLDSVNQLLERLRAAFEREERFVADAAHELRTPIAVLKVQLHNLREQLTEHRPELQDLEHAVERMHCLVEQVLMLHRLGPEQMNRRFEILDLHALVQGVAASCYASIEVRNQRMELVADAEAREGRATVAGDPFLLETLTRNLLDNANKYTHDGGQIRLCLYCTEGNVVLRVEDDGPGIALTAREHVFDRFRRAGGDMHASGVSGSGLGLAIVRNIAELHGACIEVGDSTFASGACFTVAFHRDAGARN